MREGEKGGREEKSVEGEGDGLVRGDKRKREGKVDRERGRDRDR